MDDTFCQTLTSCSTGCEGSPYPPPPVVGGGEMMMMIMHDGYHDS